MKLTDFLNCSTKVQFLPDFDMKPDTPWQGIRAICYEGADYKGKKTKVFAHIGFPASKEGEQVPAVVLDGTLPLIRVGEEPAGFGKISFPIEVPADFTDLAAEVCYLTEPMTYNEKDQPTKVWASAAAHISGNRVTARVPEGACCYFVTLTGVADGVTYVTQTALVEKE